MPVHENHQVYSIVYKESSANVKERDDDVQAIREFDGGVVTCYSMVLPRRASAIIAHIACSVRIFQTRRR